MTGVSLVSLTSPRRSRGQRPPKEHARFRPVTLDSTCSHAKCRGCLFFTEPAKKTTLYHLGQSWVGEGKLLDCIVYLEKNFGLRLVCDILVVECDANCGALALGGYSRSRAVDEHMSHRDGGQREKVGLVAPRDARLLHELEVGFVNEAGSVQRPAIAGRELAPRNAAKLIVYVRYQLIERFTSTNTNPLIYLDSRLPSASGWVRGENMGLVTKKGNEYSVTPRPVPQVTKNAPSRRRSCVGPHLL